MYILGRKIGQTIVIDGDIEITVCAIGYNLVRLGIIAPRSRVIQRGEKVNEDRDRRSEDEETHTG